MSIRSLEMIETCASLEIFYTIEKLVCKRMSIRLDAPQFYCGVIDLKKRDSECFSTNYMDLILQQRVNMNCSELLSPSVG